MSELEPGSSHSVGTLSLLLCPGCVTSHRDRSSCAVSSSSHTQRTHLRVRTSVVLMGRALTYGSELLLCLWDERSLTDQNFCCAYGTRTHLRVRISVVLMGRALTYGSELLLCLWDEHLRVRTSVVFMGRALSYGFRMYIVRM
jgi:hypothetical protein